MPELPDLEHIKEVLSQRLEGKKVERVEVLRPLILRCLQQKLTSISEGKPLQSVQRRGKFLLLSFKGGTLVFHLMLSGRLKLAQKGERRGSRICLILGFDSGQELRYFDPKLMGRVYLAQGEDFSGIPQFSELGPDALDEFPNLEEFKSRLRHFRGMLKNLLTNQRFLAGIGNAYADEILFAAHISPLRKTPGLSSGEVESLHRAICSVLTEAIGIIRERVGGRIDVEERGFLKVHRKGGSPCPVCGAILSEISPHRRITTFCRNCHR